MQNEHIAGESLAKPADGKELDVKPPDLPGEVLSSRPLPCVII